MHTINLRKGFVCVQYVFATHHEDGSFNALRVWGICFAFKPPRIQAPLFIIPPKIP